jgi:hypothetical protein
VSAPGATPARHLQINTGAEYRISKPELSTLLRTGSFYFALTDVAGPQTAYASGGIGMLMPEMGIQLGVN